MSKVSLVHANDNQKSIRKSIFQVLNSIPHETNTIESVIIKPNLCYYWDTTTGQTTDPRVVGSIIDWIRARHGADTDIKIAEADASAMKTKHAFKILGYERLAQNKDVQLFNLSKDEIIQKQAVINQQKLTFTIPVSLLKTDLFINVPKLKVHIVNDIYITCALKNIFGCIASPRKIRYHKVLNEAIVGINSILQPKITVVDGIWALASAPVKLGLIMTSDNPLSIDWVASQIMGFNPHKINFIKLAIKEGLGNPQDIAIIGDDYYNTVRNAFPKTNIRFSKLLTSLQLQMLRLYTKITGDVTNPILEQ